MEGGPMLDFCNSRILEQQRKIRSRLFSEYEVAAMMRELANTIKFLHQQLGIAHRDIKLENILLSGDFVPGVRGQIKLVDFGFAKEALDTELAKTLKTACYTPEYVPPEI